MKTYDPNDRKDYRREELHPEVCELFDHARSSMGKSVVPSMVDMAIHLQETRSVYTACNYVRYLLFHEMNYADVFGEQAIRFDKQLEHYQQCIELELKVDDLQRTVSQMADQMEQMQTVMMNMAGMLSKGKLALVRSA